jgi:hypothetical protein
MDESPTAADPAVLEPCVPALAGRSAPGPRRRARAAARLMLRPVAYSWCLGLLAAILAAAAVESPASAYQTAPNSTGDANYSSVVRAITPRTLGVSARVLGHDNLVRLANHGHRTVVVYGYSRDEYARLLADGTVQLNLRSPAFYLNEYRFGDRHVPSYADARAAPQWRTMDHSFELVWHDHRIHVANGGGPPAGTRRNTLLSAYRIPLRIEGRPGAITGNLYWIGGHGHGHASWELFAVPPALLLLLLLVFDSVRRPGRSRAAPRTAR